MRDFAQNFANTYKYGYQGSEKDIEVSGAGNSYRTEFRQLDPRLGRWFSVDEDFKGYESPYTSMDNDPINKTDVLGLTGDNVVIGGKAFTKGAKVKTNDKGNDLQNVKLQGGFKNENGTPIHTDASGNKYTYSYENNGVVFHKLEPASPSEQKTEQASAPLKTPDKQSEAGMPSKSTSTAGKTQNNEGSSEKVVKEKSSNGGDVNLAQKKQSSSTGVKKKTEEVLKKTSEGRAIAGAVNGTIQTGMEAANRLPDKNIPKNVYKQTKAAEEAAAKTFKVVGAVTDVIGKTLGVVSVVEHFGGAVDAYQKGDALGVITNSFKVGIDVLFITTKSTNPIVLGAGVVYGIADYFTSD